MHKRTLALLTVANLAAASCGNGDPVLTEAPAPQPALTRDQASAIDGALLTVEESDTMFCLTAVSEVLDLHVVDRCLRVPFAAVELMQGGRTPRGLFDERYSTVSLWVMPLAEAVVDIEVEDGQVDPIFRGDSGALMIISEAVSNITPMTLVVVYGGRTLRCRLTQGSNNCLSE